MRTVLLVEDDEDAREAVSEALLDAGYHVTTASNGAIALDALRASDDLPDLVLLDLMMPVMDGARFLEELRRDPRLASTSVVILTADGRAIAKAAALGVAEALRKPVALDALLAIASRYCEPV